MQHTKLIQLGVNIQHSLFKMCYFRNTVTLICFRRQNSNEDFESNIYPYLIDKIYDITMYPSLLISNKT